MASSPSKSEPAKVEQIITEFFAKSLHIILESRSPYVSSRNYSGEQTVSSPSSSSSSSSVRPRDKWFNLALRECPASLENLDFWRQSNLEPLVIDVILVQRSRNLDMVQRSPVFKGNPLRNPSLKDKFLGGWNASQEEFISETKCEKVIERWVVQYESRKSTGILRDLSSRSKKAGSSTSFHSLETPTLYYKTYKRSIILLRSLYVTVRLLPAYKLFRDLNSSGQILPFSLSYKVSSFVEPFTRREEAEMQQFSFVPVDTCCGRLCLSVSYRLKLLDVSSEPSTTPIATQFISDYVGSPTTDPLRKLPFLPLTQSPVSRSPVTFARRHSWSNDLHRVAPLMSPSPSPTYSDSRSLASNPNSHHLPPRGHVNMDISPPISSRHHLLPDILQLNNESLGHKKNMSFDEYWPSPPFSPSPSPSPPTHLPGSHLSKALLRSESAPVSIPSARFGMSRGTTNPVLPSSPSSKCTRDGCSSRADNVRAQTSRVSVSHSSPDSKYRTTQDPVGSGEFRTSSTVQKMLSFGKDEIGSFSGAKIPFSRSSSRLSFQDEFDDSEFTCPFAVDDDDITDPCNRSESFESKGHISETLESRDPFPVRKSHDAAIGSLVRMLQTAPPLRQDLSNSAKFSLVSKAESWIKKIQPNQLVEYVDPQIAISDTGVVASGLVVSKTTADALEDLRGFREMKDLLLQQGGYQSQDAVRTAKTVARGTSKF